MKKLISIIAILSVLILTSCQSYKKVPYLQNNDTVDLTPATGLYVPKLMPNDQFTVTVNDPTNSEAVRMFNMTAKLNRSGSGSSQSLESLAQSNSSQESMVIYTVDPEGNIDFPLLGKLHVAGMTKYELENYIADKIYKAYTKERPIVVIYFTNFKVTVLGEVGHSGQISVSNGKINIFEAIAQAGDLKINGRRDNIKIIRENERGEKSIHEINLNDARVICSPYYQLQQNDIVYVTPNKAAAKAAGIPGDMSVWFSSTSMLMSVTTFVISLINLSK